MSPKPTPAPRNQPQPTATEPPPFKGSVTISVITDKKGEVWYVTWVNGVNLAKTQSLGDTLNFAEDVITGHRDKKGHFTS